MKELWLNYKDEKGKAKRVLVEGESFTIGRTPDNDLQIPLNNLSRQHAKIERFADVFIISDCDSSNGSTLNDEPIEKPTDLKDGDILNLGDAVEIEAEFPADRKKAEGQDGAGGADSEAASASASASAGSSGSAKSAAASGSEVSGSSSLWLFMLAPILMVLVLLGLGGAILIARSQKEPEVAKNDIIDTKKDDDESPQNIDKTTPEPVTPTPTVTTTSTATPISNSGGTTIPTNSPPEEITPTPKVSTDTEKIRGASTSFLRKIAGNDPKIFLLDKQISLMNGTLNKFKNSGALAENIKNAKKNSSQIISIAESRNLKPQFLANAALTKLGNEKGDVVAAAQSLAEPLSNIIKRFGNESADENLLVIAAYNGNISGEQLQNTAGVFANNFQNANLRTIRSIWFFKENGKLSDEQFNFALQYLAIGTITQNPKNFNVSAEPLIF